MTTVQSVLDLFDRLSPLDQLDRLMLIVGMPPQHQPPNTLSLFQRQDAILAWAAERGDVGVASVVKGLEQLIEKQQEARNDANTADVSEASQYSLTITMKVLLDHTRDPLLLIPQTAYAHCRIGDAYSIRFLVSHDCYVTVLCFGTSGRVYRLFPNPFHRDPRVIGSQSQEIPAQGFHLI